MLKKDKPEFVNKLTDQLKDASSYVLVDYSGLSVKMQQDLKNRLKEANARLEVVKNTLFKIAGGNAKAPKDILDDTVLAGPSALIITSDDPVAPIQVLGKFATEFELPEFKVGVVEGSFQDKDSLIKISKLPSKEVLYAQVVGSFSQPMYGLVSTLQGNLQKLVYILGEAAKGK